MWNLCTAPCSATVAGAEALLLVPRLFGSQGRSVRPPVLPPQAGRFSFNSGAAPAPPDRGAARGHAYNLRMISALPDSVRAAVIERFTLLVNHVLAAEPAATQRLRAHVESCVSLQIDGWPSVLPRLP